MAVSEDDLLHRLLSAYAEEVRTTASLTRHVGLAARAGDRAGFAAASAAYEDARRRSEACLLSIQICREMTEARSRSASHGGWSLVPPSTTDPVFAPDLKNPYQPIRINTAA